MKEAIDQDGFTILPEPFAPSLLDQLLRDIDREAPRRSRAGIRHALALEPSRLLRGNGFLAKSRAKFWVQMHLRFERHCLISRPLQIGLSRGIRILPSLSARESICRDGDRGR